MVKDNARPRRCCSWSRPIALQEAMKQELDRLEDQGVLKVSHSDWPSPMVVEPKSNGIIPICGDYKGANSQSLEVEQYPLPCPEDVVTSLAGRKNAQSWISAYQQMALKKSSNGT